MTDKADPLMILMKTIRDKVDNAEKKLDTIQESGNDIKIQVAVIAEKVTALEKKTAKFVTRSEVKLAYTIVTATFIATISGASFYIKKILGS